jgi:hypothetical protein
LRVIGLVAFCASVSSCNLYFSDLQIMNGTDDRVSNVTISAAGESWKLRDLGSGQRADFYHHLAGEGGAAIAWTWRGKGYSGEGCYYTRGMPAKGTITIDGEKLTYWCG